MKKEILLTQCSICGKPVEEEKARRYGDGVYVKKTYYCSDECWFKRGRVLGSKEGVRCPFYNEDRMCVTPGKDISMAVPCTVFRGNYLTACDVYPLYASHERTRSMLGL